MTSVNSSNVTTALKFLSDVNDKGYSDIVIKKYMLDKRGLTSDEIEEAFRIHKDRLVTMKAGNEDSKSKKERRSLESGRAERPEKSTSFAAQNEARDVNFLMPSKRAKGQKLINEFLDGEKSYCSILECLNNDY